MSKDDMDDGGMSDNGMNDDDDDGRACNIPS